MDSRQRAVTGRALGKGTERQIQKPGLGRALGGEKGLWVVKLEKMLSCLHHLMVYTLTVFTLSYKHVNPARPASPGPACSSLQQQSDIRKQRAATRHACRRQHRCAHSRVVVVLPEPDPHLLNGGLGLVTDGQLDVSAAVPGGARWWMGAGGQGPE